MNIRAAAGLLFCLGLWCMTFAVSAGRWTHDPVYAYGWFVPLLCVAFATRRLSHLLAGSSGNLHLQPPHHPALANGILIAVAISVVPFEILRRDFFFNRMDTWILAVTAISVTLFTSGWLAGTEFRRATIFPLLFFLTAMPWPYRWESKVTIGLMTLVSQGTAELLRAGGIAAVANGTVIALQDGPVGISEACSGVKSLQASLMIGFAVGELFLLHPLRRMTLVAIALALAMITNLLRTLMLCLLVDHLGTGGFQRYHDKVGGAALFLLPIAIWGAGKLMAGKENPGTKSIESTTNHPTENSTTSSPGVLATLRKLWQADWRQLPDFRPALILALLSFLGVQAWAIALDYLEPPFARPIFTFQPVSGMNIEMMPLAPEIQQNLHPTQADSVIVKSPDFPDGSAVCYHFFWAPHEENRYASSHRPDICMPAAGWKMANTVKKITDELSPKKLTWYVFDFEANNSRAMQLWAIWGNGQPLPIDFPDQHGAATPKANWAGIPGKHSPSVEVVSCILNYRGTEPPVKQGMQLLRNVFTCSPPVPVAEPAQHPSVKSRNP